MRHTNFAATSAKGGTICKGSHTQVDTVLYIYTLLIFNYLLTRTTFCGLERYIRTVAEDLQDIYSIVKDNEAKLGGLNK
jgi:hypothetical protein